MITLALIALVAAIVNGALGYGFSSVAVPLSLLIVSNRVLNPAIVLVEIPVNAHALWCNRRALPRVWRRVAFLGLGLLPGVAVGAVIVTRVDAAPLRLATFAVLLPLLLLQTAGRRRPIRAARSAEGVLGLVVGALYAVTTISGPPLAAFLNNQGLDKEEFRAALGAIRFVQAVLTAIAYAHSALFSAESMTIVAWFVPAVVLGAALGNAMGNRARDESFRRTCMAVDAAIVAFAISATLRSMGLVESVAAYLPLAAVMLFDAVVLYRFFRTQKPMMSSCEKAQAT